METLEQAKRGACDLHWLAALLTGCHEAAGGISQQAIELTDDPNAFFSTWMHEWSRKLVIAKALTAIRRDLAASARRTALRPAETSAIPPQSWMPDTGATKSELEQALLSIDLFPRASVLLLVFEAVPLKDAAILLDVDPELLRRAQGAAVRELTTNLARMRG